MSVEGAACYKCCCFLDCSSTSNKERHVSLLLFPWRTIGPWSVGCVSLGAQTLPLLTHHTQTCSKHLVNAKERHLYADEVPSLTLSSNNWSLGNNWKKLHRYRFTSLGDEPVTTAITTLFARAAIKHQSTCAFPEVPEIVSPSTPSSPGLLGRRVGGSRTKRNGEVGGDPRKVMQGPQRKWTDTRSLHQRTM